MTFEVRQTLEFENWLDGLRDRQAQARIAKTIVKLQSGLFGKHESVGGGVSELKLGGAGPGYRVYFTRRENIVIVLLCGGDKDSQPKDIKFAQALAAGL